MIFKFNCFPRNAFGVWRIFVSNPLKSEMTSDVTKNYFLVWIKRLRIWDRLLSIRFRNLRITHLGRLKRWLKLFQNKSHFLTQQGNFRYYQSPPPPSRSPGPHNFGRGMWVVQKSSDSVGGVRGKKIRNCWKILTILSVFLFICFLHK